MSVGFSDVFVSACGIKKSDDGLSNNEDIALALELGVDGYAEGDGFSE